MTSTVFLVFMLFWGAEAQLAHDRATFGSLENMSLPLSYSSTILEGEQQGCPPEEQLEMARAEISMEV